METTTITMIAILVVIALLLVWLSLSMAATEGAVGRVTRASLNNLILEIQTDTEASQFIRDKKIKRIHKVQRLIADRYATAGSCAFFRITCNVLDGVLVAAIASLCDAPLWAGLLVGFVFALVVAVISLLVRPRSAGASKPVDLMLKHADAASVAVALTPFAKIGGQKDAKRHSNDLSDDEELEKIQLEQGRATIDRLVEANDFDPEVSEMLRNVLTLSETLTREIMVPRTDMICIERGETLENMLKLCSRSGFSRIPVIGDDVDDLVGVAYLKDAVRATAFNPAAISRDVESIVRDPMLVPESKPVDDLFHQMQRTRQHVAIVVDEYGGIAGLSPSKTPSNRSSANWRTSTTVPSMPIRNKSARTNGACRHARPSPTWRRSSKSTSTRTTSTRYTVCSPSCLAACRSSVRRPSPGACA